MPIDDKYRPRNISDIAVNNNDVLANLYRHSLEILKIQETIRLALGPPLAQHLHVANVSPDTIIIFTDSQAWATKLRFQTQDIINIVKKTTGYTRLESVRIKLSPLLRTTTTPGSPLSISASTPRLLKKVAKNINDTAIQEALIKLSRNLKP